MQANQQAGEKIMSMDTAHDSQGFPTGAAGKPPRPFQGLGRAHFYGIFLGHFQ
jgi:hypothetical protein